MPILKRIKLALVIIALAFFIAIFAKKCRNAHAGEMLCNDFGMVEIGDGFIDSGGNVSGDLLFGVHNALNIGYSTYVNTGPGYCLDNGLLLDNDGLRGCTYAAEGPTRDVRLYSHSAWGGASTFTAGANVYIAGGDGSSRYTIVDYTACAGDTMTVTVDGVPYSLVEGVHWFALTDNNTTCTYLASALLIAGISGSCSGSVLHMDRGTLSYAMSAATGDVTCATVFNGNDGIVEIQSLAVLQGGAVLPSNSSTSPVAPVACDSSSFGRLELVDDTNDAAGTSICYCGKTDDTTYDWLELDNTACPFY